MKVLYIYSGKRKNKFKGEMGVDYPDTQFYGLNHLADFGVYAEFKEASSAFGFRLKHFFSYFLTSGYDVVFGASILFMMVFKKILKPKRKFVLLNTGLFRTIYANKNKTWRLKAIRYLIKSIDVIVCLSRVQMDYLKREVPKLEGKLYFIPLGVDVKYYQPNYANRKNYILSGGRDNGRDYKTVIETAKLMPKEEFQIFCSPRNMKGINEIPKNVKVFYDVPYNEVSIKYREAKLLLLLTHDDNFLDSADCSGQTVLLDAMASGLSVIASRKKYLKDYVEEGKDIMCVDFYDAADAKRKIEMLNSNMAFREKLARNAREKVEQNFSTKKMAENLASLFKQITG